MNVYYYKRMWGGRYGGVQVAIGSSEIRAGSNAICFFESYQDSNEAGHIKFQGDAHFLFPSCIWRWLVRTADARPFMKLNFFDTIFFSPFLVRYMRSVVVVVVGAFTLAIIAMPKNAKRNNSRGRRTYIHGQNSIGHKYVRSCFFLFGILASSALPRTNERVQLELNSQAKTPSNKRIYYPNVSIYVSYIFFFISCVVRYNRWQRVHYSTDQINERNVNSRKWKSFAELDAAATGIFFLWNVNAVPRGCLHIVMMPIKCWVSFTVSADDFSYGWRTFFRGTRFTQLTRDILLLAG